MRAKEMHKYLTENYGKVVHDIEAKDIFLFMVENKPIAGMYTHSYGFNTREGRALKSQFDTYYHQ
jgi:hypothetical protein